MFAERTNWDTRPNRLSALLEERRRLGLPILDLTVSNPTQCGFDFDQNALLSALADPATLRYDPDPRGLASARRAVASYYAGQGVSVDPDQMLLTTGTSEGYSFLFRLLAGPGDEVLSPLPSYPLFDLLADVNDVKLRPYSLHYGDGWRIDLEHLAGAITPLTRAIIVVTPNNPTGSLLQRGELEALVRLARDHNLAIIADEVFRDYLWQAGADETGSVAAVDGCLTFTLSGLSKIAALPQMKLAWIVANGPRDLRAEALARLEVIADTYLSISTPVQLAAPKLLAKRDGLQRQILRRVQANLNQLDARLARGTPCSRLRAEGGWYAVLRVPNTRSDEDWALALLERGVYLHPGHFFGFATDGYLVVSLITPEPPFATGVERIVETVSAGA
jgi:alanine-synthesizing transaminase